MKILLLTKTTSPVFCSGESSFDYCNRQNTIHQTTSQRQGLCAHVPLLRVRGGVQGLPETVLPTRGGPVLHPPSLLLPRPPPLPRPILLHGALPRHQKAHDHQLECLCGGGLGGGIREAPILSLAKHSGRRRSDRPDVGLDLNLGRVHYFLCDRHCADRREPGVARENGVKRLEGSYVHRRCLMQQLSGETRKEMFRVFREGISLQHQTLR